VRSKYQVDSPNLFCCDDRQGSSFWKGVMWAAKTAKMENGKKIRFWEDIWFGSYSLAIQYWDIYSIVNEKGITICG
jgi:hypothetical protein